MDILQWTLENIERVGVATVLVLVIAGLIWGIKFLYAEKAAEVKARKECEEDRFKRAEEFGDMKAKVASMETRIEVQGTVREEIQSLSKVMLENLRPRHD